MSMSSMPFFDPNIPVYPSSPTPPSSPPTPPANPAGSPGSAPMGGHYASVPYGGPIFTSPTTSGPLHVPQSWGTPCEPPPSLFEESMAEKILWIDKTDSPPRYSPDGFTFDWGRKKVVPYVNGTNLQLTSVMPPMNEINRAFVDCLEASAKKKKVRRAIPPVNCQPLYDAEFRTTCDHLTNILIVGDTNVTVRPGRKASKANEPVPPEPDVRRLSRPALGKTVVFLCSQPDVLGVFAWHDNKFGFAVMEDTVVMVEVSDKSSMFPHACPECGSQAYVGFSSIQCSNFACKHYDSSL